MPPRIKAKLGEVVDVTFSLNYKRSEVDRLPDRDQWQAFLLALNVGNDTILPTDGHEAGWPFSSPGFPKQAPIRPTDDEFERFPPVTVTQDDQKITAAIWINPAFRPKAKAKPLFAAGQVLEMLCLYCPRDLGGAGVVDRRRLNVVAEVEIVAAEGASAGGADGSEETVADLFRRGSGS